MFQQLVPLLRQRSILLTVTLVEDDQVRVNVMPKKLAESENNTLTTPMSFTGTAEELDKQLPAAISSFVASHLQLKNTLMRAKAEMDAAAKAAQEEARNKAKSAKKGNDTAAKATATEKKDAEKKEEETKAPAPPSLPGLFDPPAAAAAPPGPASAEAVSPAVEADEERELLAEISEVEGDDEDTELRCKGGIPS
jgi:PRTRC genetic system protein E